MMLSWLDTGLQILAVFLLFVWFSGWLMLGRPNPLRHAPHRANDLREDAIMLPVLAYVATLLLVSSLLKIIANTPAEPKTMAGFFAGISAQVAGGLTCLMLGAWRFDGGMKAFLLGTRDRRNGMHLAAVFAFAAILAIGLCPLILRLTVSLYLSFRPAHEFPRHSTLEMLHDETQPAAHILSLWVGAAVIAPWAEELFFRGMIQSQILRSSRNPALAVAVSSIAFTLAHIQQPHAMPALLALAVLLGLVYERTSSLLLCVCIHAAFNLKTLLWDALGAAG